MRFMRRGGKLNVVRNVVIAAICGLAAGAALSARADGIEFPKDAGVINVRDLGAKGDGRQDDTAAIQAALDKDPNEGRIVYLPNGTYLISNALRWPTAAGSGRGTIVQGQSRDKTIVRLKDACPGYDDAKSPQTMVLGGTDPAQRVRNSVCDLTIDAGKENVGAIGLQFTANGPGCVRNVTIRSRDGKGRIGLDMTRAHEVGPVLVKNLRVSGFDFGIRTARALNGMTFEHIELEKQARFGFVNEGQCVTIRDLTARNVDTAVIHAEGNGVLALTDSSLIGIGIASTKPAVLSDSVLLARNVTTSGYRESVRNRTGDHQPKGKKVALFASQPIQNLFPSPPRSLEPSVKETPEIPWDDLRAWAGPSQFGGKPDDELDDHVAIQAAIDSGASTVYLPAGNYRLGDTVVIRKNVRRVIGCGAVLRSGALGSKAAFKIVEGSARTVVFEQIVGDSSAPCVLENISKRTLAIKDSENISGQMTGNGDLFLENVISNARCRWQFSRQNVWARQWSVEVGNSPIRNAGASVWVLGLNAQRGGTLVEATDGGKTEVLGGLCQSLAAAQSMPMFVSRDSSVSIVLGEVMRNGTADGVLVSETRGGVTKTFTPTKRPGSPSSRVALYAGIAK
jgi:hypothetical protein